MRAILVVFLFGILSKTCFTQTNKSFDDVRNVYDDKGDYYFDKKDYKKAIVYYNMAYKKDSSNYYSVLKKAEAFASLDLLDQAAESFSILFGTNLRIPNEYRLEYAMLLLKNKNITGFEKWMATYNDFVNTEIHNFTSGTEVRAKMYKDSSLVIVENESVLNTPESEICPLVYHNTLIFASTRKNLAGSSSNSFYNLFSAGYLDDGQLGRLNSFNKSINSTQSESSIAFSENSNSIYFTRSASVNSALKTYSAAIPLDYNDKLIIHDFSIDGFSNIGEVSFNSVGTKMYFVSDAPGGMGGLDIYSSDYVNGKWSKPVNLGKNINSAKNEMYPVVLNDTILYFSSAGHNSLGGLDLYSVNLKQENSIPKNLGNKVNSEYDDYALSFSANGLTGYFCSNRPGGFGKEDIYRVHLLNIKVKLPAYRFKKKTFMESDKINLYLSNGEEFNIASPDKKGFDFGFQPGESYKMIIQHENPYATDIIYNTKLSPDQRKKAFLAPDPIERSEIRLETGMKYDYTAGIRPISAEFKNALNEMSKSYQNSNTNTIDLTALAKELALKDGEIYTVQFVKDESQPADNKSKGVSGLFINDQKINVAGRSFFIVLPLDVQANFNIQTDIASFKESFNPKKTGSVKVDASPVYKEAPIKQFEGFPILVNTESFSEANNKVMARKFTIVPGTMYILTLGKTDPGTGKKLEITIPLTKGVKYNLGTDAVPDNEYNKALSQMTAIQPASNNSNEELIDISVLSKELELLPQDSIVFSLLPAPQIVTQAAGARNVLSTLDVDGRRYFVTSKQKLQVKLKLEQNKKVNIQTDLAYIKDNFVPTTIFMKVDTSSFRSNIKALSKPTISDPVFDLIVVNFDLNNYAIRPDAKTIITDKVIKVLKGNSRLYVTIKGYTDALGDAAYNEKLSQNRAQAVKDFLTSNGIGDNRIRTFSYGASLALKDGVKLEDLSEEELQKYRKVEIVIYLPK
jgi:outer membrane protein OmpA-like peptidoglycan-associated protein